MKKNQEKTQIILLLVGMFLIIATYYYYPKISEEKIFKPDSAESVLDQTPDETKSNTFENVEYKGLYDLDKTFTVKSKKAYISNEEPDIVYMTDMHVVLYLKDGRIINIRSDKGNYNKSTYDCFFEQNVKASDDQTEIFAENLDLLATADTVAIYNGVKMNDEKGSIEADKVDYDFETKRFKVSMFDDTNIKMKLIK